MRIYFCSSGKDVFRGYMGRLCYQRWKKEKGADIYSVYPGTIGSKPSEFEKKKRVFASMYQDHQYYVLADNTWFPYGEPFLERGMEILKEHPEFGMLSMLPFGAKLTPWTASSGRPFASFETRVVSQQETVGGIRFCRRVELTHEEWVEQTGPGYDTEHCEALREAGYRVGFFRDLRCTNLGEGWE